MNNREIVTDEKKRKYRDRLNELKKKDVGLI